MVGLSKVYLHSENMENLNHCMNIKQAKHIVNAHKHNFLNSFCNNGHFHVKQPENNRKSVKTQERENALMKLVL